MAHEDLITLFTHPEYNLRIEDWIVWQDLFEGKHQILTQTKYLWLHRIETLGNEVRIQSSSGQTRTTHTTPKSTDLRRIRERNTRYLNFSEILISIWTSLFFKDGIDYTEVFSQNKEDQENLFTEEEFTNIDGLGAHLDSFIKNQLFVDRLNLGKTVTIVNALSNQQVQSEPEEGDHRIILERVTPLIMKDWEIEDIDPHRVGRFNKIRYEYKVIPQRKSLEQIANIVLRSRVYELGFIQEKDKEEPAQAVFVTIYEEARDEKGQEIRNKNNQKQWRIFRPAEPLMSGTDFVKEIPIAIIDDDSWLKDAVQESLRYHNLRSTKDHIQYSQGYDKAFIIGIDPASDYIKFMGASVWTMLPEGATVTTLPPVSVEGYENSLNVAIDSIFKVGLNMLRTMPADSRQVQASDTIREDKNNTVAVVEAALQEFQGYLDDIVRNVATFKGKEGFKGRIKLNPDITTDDVQQFTEIALAFRDSIRQIPVINEAVIKKAVKKLNLPKEDEERALQAITEASQNGGLTPQQNNLQRQPSNIREIINGERNGTTAQIEGPTGDPVN